MEKGKTLNEFKEDLIEGVIGGIDELNDIDEIYMFAKSNGYKFSKETLESSDIVDDIFDCVAGGRQLNAYDNNLWNVEN